MVKLQKQGTQNTSLQHAEVIEAFQFDRVKLLHMEQTNYSGSPKCSSYLTTPFSIGPSGSGRAWTLQLLHQYMSEDF